MFLINDQYYPASARLVQMDRSKTRKKKPGDLPPRLVIQFEWKIQEHYETQIAIRNLLWLLYDKVYSGFQNDTYAVEFSHEYGNVFRVNRV